MNLDLFSVLTLISRWLHIVSVVVVIGGAVFMRFALMPAAHSVLPDDLHDKLRSRLMARWKRVVHVCVAILIVTGSFNFYLTFHDNVKPIPYHPILGVKLIGAAVVFFLAIALTGSSPGFSKLRQESGKWMSVQIALAAVIILLSGLMKAVHQAALTAQ